MVRGQRRKPTVPKELCKPAEPERRTLSFGAGQQSAHRRRKAVPGIYGYLCPALAYGIVIKLQNLLFVRSCVPDWVQLLEQRNTRTQKSKFIFISFCSEGALKSALHIKGCSNREEYHHRQKINHYPVIYRTVMVVCGKVAIFTVSLASPPNGKVDGVLLRTVLHKRSSERFLRSN